MSEDKTSNLEELSKMIEACRSLKGDMLCNLDEHDGTISELSEYHIMLAISHVEIVYQNLKMARLNLVKKLAARCTRGSTPRGGAGTPCP